MKAKKHTLNDRITIRFTRRDLDKLYAISTIIDTTPVSLAREAVRKMIESKTMTHDLT